MNILILHRLGDPRYWGHASAELELCLPRHAPQHNYLVHDASLPLPRYVRNLPCDAVVLGTTFLQARFRQSRLDHCLEEYDFLRNTDAYKIALPQDDYDCSARLDRWLTSWNVDCVYTPLRSHWDILYPSYLANGRQVKLAYTGYISEELLLRATRTKPSKDRPIDVCYRARKLPPYFGSLGVAKNQIGERFRRAFADQPWRLDISVEWSDLIPGSRWLDFVENARFTLGTNSGSGLLDAEGELSRRIDEYLLKNPHADFKQIEAACFPGEDGRYEFTAISPRNLEAGLLETAQVLVPGEYGNLLEPWMHYIPVAEDLSNKCEVADAMRDTSRVARMTAAAKDALLSHNELRLTSHVAQLLADIESGSPQRGTQALDEQFVRAAKRYHARSLRVDRFRWALQRTRSSIAILASRRAPQILRLHRKLWPR